MSNKFNPSYAHFDPLSTIRQNLGSVAKTYGRKRMISDNFEVAITDLEAGDIIILCPILSSAILHSFKIANDVLDSVADLTMDIGVCDADGVTVSTLDSLDMFADENTTFQTATLPAAALDHAFLLTQDIVNAFGAQLWERINLHEAAEFTEDPVRLWFLCLRVGVVAATPVAGTIGFQVEYTLD